MKNKQRKFGSMCLAAGLCCACTIIFGAQTAFSQQGPDSAHADPAGQAPVERKAGEMPWSIAAAETPSVLEAALPFGEAPAGTSDQSAEPAEHPAHGGIKVHGHWIIDVKNPDGTLAQHRVFENSLIDNGSLAIMLLSGYAVPGDFSILLQTTTTGLTSPCAPSVGCALVQSPTLMLGSYICAVFAPSCFSGVARAVNFGPTASSVVLTGQLTAPLAGSIDGVETVVGICGVAETITGSTATFGPDTTLAPSSCPTQTFNGKSNVLDLFTQTGITPMPITAGQFVSVSVTLTFS